MRLALAAYRTASATLPDATVLTGEQPERIAADVAAFLDRL